MAPTFGVDRIRRSSSEFVFGSRPCRQAEDRRRPHGAMERPDVRKWPVGKTSAASFRAWRPRQTGRSGLSDTLLPYMDVALEAFGPDRLMFGSDWPVARLAVDYEPWVELCRKFISTLSEDEPRQSRGAMRSGSTGWTDGPDG